MTDPVRVRTPWQSASLMLRRRLLRRLISAPGGLRHERFAVLANDTVSEEVLVAGLYEETLLTTLFEQLFAPRRAEFAAGVALDIGANIGNHSVFMGRYFAKVISFEPNPVALAMLRCNLELAGAAHAQIFGVGLADRPGTFEFRQNRSGNLGGSGFAFAGLSVGVPIECEVARGDDLLTPAVLGGPLRLIKIDIEGAELAALRGLELTLRREQPIVLFESNRTLGPGGGREVFALLRKLGYAQFLAIEEPLLFSGRLGRLLTRLLRGERLSIRPIESPEHPPYSLLVAMPAATPPPS